MRSTHCLGYQPTGHRKRSGGWRWPFTVSIPPCGGNYERWPTVGEENEPKEPETIGELIESVVGPAVTKAVEESRKAWAKDLADLLDLGADGSGVPAGETPPVTDPPTPDPTGGDGGDGGTGGDGGAGDGGMTPLRGRKLSWL